MRTSAPSSPVQSALKKEKRSFLRWLECWLETPMIVLGFIWLALLILELTFGLSPVLATISIVIWIIFALEFALKLILAEEKLGYVARNWLPAIALFAPALRVFRISRVVRLMRLARVTRGLIFLKLLSSLSRGMRATASSMKRRGFGYVVVLTLVVVFGGAAGMLAFEHENPDGRGLHDYGTALWWTSMMLTTTGSDYWPQTPEGRLLCFLLALYAFGVFGYIAGTLSSFFIGRDAVNRKGEIAGTKQLEQLRREIIALRGEVLAARADGEPDQVSKAQPKPNNPAL